MPLLASILAIAMCSHVVFSLDKEHQDYILKIHNDYRKNVRNACRMEKMEYDMVLEKQAQKWADGCVFEHEQVKGRGENLAWNTAKDPEKDLMANSAKNWYDEVNRYSYGQYSCGYSCHYTQMVWATTNKVGCATKRCGDLRNAYTDAWYLVCFYLPAGNMNGEKPYPTSCDTPCLEGQTKDSDGLCVGGGASTEEGSENEGGEGDQAPCEDTNSKCAGWAEDQECEKNPRYMLKSCRKSCKVCGGTGEGKTDGGKTGGNTGGNEGPCEDTKSKCSRWAGDNQCEINPRYMLKWCRKSCKVCGGADEGKTDESKTGGNEATTECPEDTNSKCQYWKRKGLCTKNKEYMQRQCMRTCGFCTP